MAVIKRRFEMRVVTHLDDLPLYFGLRFPEIFQHNSDSLAAGEVRHGHPELELTLGKLIAIRLVAYKWDEIRVRDINRCADLGGGSQSLLMPSLTNRDNFAIPAGRYQIKEGTVR